MATSQGLPPPGTYYTEFAVDKRREEKSNTVNDDCHALARQYLVAEEQKTAKKCKQHMANHLASEDEKTAKKCKK